MVDKPNLVPQDAWEAADKAHDRDRIIFPNTAYQAAVEAAAPLILAAELERQAERQDRNAGLLLDQLEGSYDTEAEVIARELRCDAVYFRSHASELRSLSTKEDS